MTQPNQSELEKNKLGIAFTVTREEMQRSKDEHILEHMTAEYSRNLGERIGQMKKWEMYPLDDQLVKRLEVVVFTPDELREFITKSNHQAVQAFGEKVLKEAKWLAYDDSEGEAINAVPASVITSLLKGESK